MHLLLPRPSTSSFTNLTSLRVPMSGPQLLWSSTYFFVLNSLWTLCALLQPRPFVFITLQTLSQKYRGRGVPLTPKIPADSALGSAWVS